MAKTSESLNNPKGTKDKKTPEIKKGTWQKIERSERATKHTESKKKG